MATTEQVLELRRLIDEPTNVTFTDAALGLRIDAALGDLRTLASVIWREKAASYAGLVDIKEGSSDRKLSQLSKNALQMSASLALSDTGQTVTGRRVSRTRPIERP